MKQALLLIDIQNDYFPGGAMELVGSVAAAAKAGQLLHAFRENGIPVLHVQHISARPGAAFFLPGTPGAQIHQSVAPRPDEPVFQKKHPNCFRNTPLLGYLRERHISQLTIAGMMTHMCIDTTTRAAADLGLSCILAGDACATRNLSYGGVRVSAENVHAAFLAALNGLFAAVRTADEIGRDLSLPG